MEIKKAGIKEIAGWPMEDVLLQGRAIKASLENGEWRWPKMTKLQSHILTSFDIDQTIPPEIHTHKLLTASKAINEAFAKLDTIDGE